jgi:Ca-activated chloride channel family protein
MRKEDKMELLKATMIELLNPLRKSDYLSIITYAGDARTLLKPTSGIEKEYIKTIIRKIEAEGSTQAVKGIKLALETGRSHFIEGGNNQIILATDGAFDIGGGNKSLRRKIKKSSETGLFLSVLGIKNEKWTNKSLKEIAQLGQGKLIRCNSLKDSQKVLEAVKESALR